MTRMLISLEENDRIWLEQQARETGVPMSEVVRQAIDAWADRQEPVASPYEVLSDLIGVVRRGIRPFRANRPWVC